MFLVVYAAVCAIVSLIAGVILAARAKKVEGVVYSKLDQVGKITNIVLIPVYFFIALFFTAMSMFCSPDYDGFLGILGWIVCVLIASTPLFGGIGLGFSVALRKKGESKKSFAVQFAGCASAVISLLLIVAFYGNLLSSLN